MDKDPRRNSIGGSYVRFVVIVIGNQNPTSNGVENILKIFKRARAWECSLWFNLFAALVIIRQTLWETFSTMHGGINKKSLLDVIWTLSQ